MKIDELLFHLLVQSFYLWNKLMWFIIARIKFASLNFSDKAVINPPFGGEFGILGAKFSLKTLKLSLIRNLKLLLMFVSTDE